MIPEAKQGAVEHALQETFGLSECEDIRMLKAGGLTSARVFRVVIWQSGVEKPDKLAEKNPWLSGVYVASVTGRIATGPSVGSRVRVSG